VHKKFLRDSNVEEGEGGYDQNGGGGKLRPNSATEQDKEKKGVCFASAPKKRGVNVLTVPGHQNAWVKEGKEGRHSIQGARET